MAALCRRESRAVWRPAGTNGALSRRQRVVFCCLLAACAGVGAAVSMATAAGASTATGFSKTGTVGSDAYAVAVDPSTGVGYAVDDGSKVQLFHLATDQAFLTVTVGSDAAAVEVDVSTDTIYVANETSHLVSVINGATDGVTATVTVGTKPDGVAVDPTTDTIYVANETSHSVSVINGATNSVTATVTVGTQPYGVAVDPTTDVVYVANHGSGSVSVINGATNAIVTTIGSIPNAFGVAANPATDKIYVTSNTKVAVISGSSNTVIVSLSVGSGAEGVAVNPTTNYVFVVDYLPTRLSVISATVVTTNTIAPGGYPRGVAVDPALNTAYVANLHTPIGVVEEATRPKVTSISPTSGTSLGGSSVVVTGSHLSGASAVYFGTQPATAYTVTSATKITVTSPPGGGAVAVSIVTTRGIGKGATFTYSTATGFSKTGTVGSDAYAVAVDPSTGVGYAVDDGSKVQLFHLATDQAFLTVTVGSDAAAVEVDVSTDTIYVANETSHLVSVINGATDGVTATVTVGTKPDGVAVDPTTDTIYVANETSHSVSVINGATNSVTATVTVGTQPYGVAVDPTTDVVYVANHGSGSVSVINGATNAIVTTIGSIPNAFGVAANPATDKIYVTSNTKVAVISGSSNTVIVSLSVGSGAEGVAVNPTTNYVFVVDYLPTRLSVISATVVTTNTIAPGGYPRGVAVDPALNTAYVANLHTPIGVVTPTAVPARQTSVATADSVSSMNHPTCTDTTVDPVNCASGDFFESVTDATTGGGATAAALSRTYNSTQAGTKGLFGYGWSTGYTMSLVTSGTTVTVTEYDGSQVTAKKSGTSYVVPAWADSVLTKSSTVWTFVRQQATTYKFNSSGQLTTVENLAGDTTTFTYTSGKLTKVTGSASRHITVTYNATGFVSKVRNPAGQATTYTYNTTGDLTKVVAPSGTSTYTYNASHDLSTVTRPGGAKVINTYDGQGRLTSQQNPDHETTTFSYSGSAFSASGGTTTITQPDGSVEVERYVDGMLQSTKQAVGTSTAVTKDYSFNATTLGQTSSRVAGATPATATYNSNGQVLTSTNPDGDETLYAYTGSSTGTPHVPAGLRYCTVSPDEHAAGVTCPSYASARTGAQTETFNTLGDSVTSTDAKGHTTHYAYTGSSTGTPHVPAGLLYCTVSPVEYATGVTCPSYGSTRAGAETQTYDAAGNVASSTTSSGATTTTCYLGDACAPGTAVGPYGLVYKSTAPTGTATTKTYNSAGDLVKVVTAYHTYSATTAYSYDAANRQVCTVSPAEYATGVRCPTSTPTPAHPPSNVTTTYYDTTGHVAETVGPTGATTLNSYDPTGQKYCTVAPAAYARTLRCPSFTAVATTSDLSTWLGAHSGPTITVFNALGEVTAQATPLGAVTSSAYNALGDVTRKTVSSGTSGAPAVTTTATYDAAGRAISTTTGTTKTRSSYDPTGHVYCTVDAVAYTAGHRCPAWSATWLTAPPKPATVPAGVALTITNGDGETVQSTTPDKGTTVSAYDATGRAYCSATAGDLASWLATHSGATYPYLCPTTPPTSAPTGTVTGYTTTIYNAAGAVTSATTPTGQTTATAYDAYGNRTNVTKGGDDTHYCYYADSCASGAPATGGVGRDLYKTTLPSSTADPTGEVTTDTYTKTGQLLTAVTPAVTTTYGYDAAGVATSVTYSGVASGYAAAANVTKTYSATGIEHTMADGTGTTTYTNDEAGDLTKASFVPATGTGLTANAVSYTYYSTGKPKTVVYPSYATHSTPAVTYTYSTTGTMASVADWLGHTTDFSYNADSDLSSIAYANGTTDAVTSDLTGQVTGISPVSTAHPSTTLATITYTRNATEQVTKETDSGALSATPAYGYDDAGRLSTTGTHSVAYDTQTDPTTLPSGAGATYNSAGELTSSTKGATTTTYTYDSIGARTKVAPSTGPTVTYGVNALGQMTSAKSTAATGPLSGTGVSFTVNAADLRVGETTSSGTQTFTWDTTGSVPKVLADGTTAFVYGPSGEVVEQVDLATTVPTYLVQDQIGSTRVLTNQTGAIVGTYFYDAYGNLTGHSGTATSPIGYAAGWETEAIAIIYLVNRYYTPGTASFLSVDPLVVTTRQPYVYATDDPVNGTDPDGLYDYYTHELIGPVSDGSTSVRTAAFVMSNMKKYVLDVFPFPITGCGSSLVDGATCKLHASDIDGTPINIGAPNCFAQGCGTVRVEDWSPTSFNFTVVSHGYFDAPGAQITFTTYQQSGEVYLQQHGDAPTTNGLKGLIAEHIAEDIAWPQQARNLTNLVHEVLGEIPGYAQQCDGNYSDGTPGQTVGPPTPGFPSTPPAGSPT
jgi:RHS repeat-associated protein